MEKLQVLRDVFGHDGFRPSQEAIVDALLEGRDVLAVMPTGAGKSVCYQLPALMMQGITLIISPLISLMSDQVMALKAAGVAAAYLNSSLTPSQQAEAIRRARLGTYKLIYVAPERLLLPQFLQFAQENRIAMVAVDEAHCVSQWGQDFRPSYRHIATFVDSLPARPVMAAFTATATKQVREDIAQLLQLQQPFSLTTGYDRPNLHFSSMKPTNRFAALCSALLSMGDESGIVYCNTRKTVEQVCEKLAGEGYSVAKYHGGMDAEARKHNQELFQYDQRRIMVATNAFGMGIDKANVRFVVHYNMPRDLESYYQEAGRAGRDGGAAECLLLYSPQDIITGKWMIEHSKEEGQFEPKLRETLQQRDMARLNQMVAYATATSCLRRKLLDYFGEYSGDVWCENCSVCDGAPFEVNTGGSHGIAIRLEQSAVGMEEKIRKRAQREERRRMEGGMTAWEKALYANLKELRKVISHASHYPAYAIFSDKTLVDMVRLRPTTPEKMLQVDGVGRIKLGLYGDAFLAVLRDGKEPNEAAFLYNPFTDALDQLQKKPEASAKKGRPLRAGEKWSQQEIAQLCDAYDSGESVAAIAKKHERNEGAIRMQLRAQGKIE